MRRKPSQMYSQHQQKSCTSHTNQPLRVYSEKNNLKSHGANRNHICTLRRAKRNLDLRSKAFEKVLKNSAQKVFFKSTKRVRKVFDQESLRKDQPKKFENFSTQKVYPYQRCSHYHYDNFLSILLIIISEKVSG